jgi:hypothetical protein
MSILTALAILLPATASAFYVESRNDDMMTPIAYDTTEAVEFRIGSAGMPDGDGSEFEAVAAAFATWAAVECVTIDFTEGARDDTPQPRHWTAWEGIEDPDFERYISVYWSDDSGQFPSPTVGFFDWAHDGMGQIIGGTIILNSRHHDWSTTGEDGLLDVQSVVTALIGRSLGITSGMEGNATFPSYAPGDTSKRELGDDDIAAISFIYGDGTCTVTDGPEDICLDIDPLEDCPPTPDVDAGPGTGDGGTGTPDTGTGTPDTGTGTPDGGTGGDAGTGDGGTGGDDDGGCSVGELDAENTPGWIALLLFVGLALTRRRHR